jgi:hypothetical protein
VRQWADRNGCTGGFERVSRIDFDPSLAGDETEVIQATGCPSGVDVELWSIADGAHNPHLPDDFGSRIFRWLEAHRRRVE